LFTFIAIRCFGGFISIKPQQGAVGAAITIGGTNFDAIASNNIVIFGSVRALVTQATTTNLTVLVPAGATFAPVKVTTGGLTWQSNERFLPTFPGTGAPVTGSIFVSHNLGTENGPYQTLIADLDGDGKPDLIVANAYAHTVSIYRNISRPGLLDTTSFAPAVDLPLNLGSSSDNPLGIEAADIDGDGKLDILVCDRINNQLLLYRNLAVPGAITTNSFNVPVVLATGNDPRNVRVADLDGDGRSDIVVPCYADNTVSIFQNFSLRGNLSTNSFGPRADLAVGSGPYEVAIADFDGDGRPDLAVVNHNASYASLFMNEVANGIVDTNGFAAEVDIPGPANCQSIVAVDVDGDGLLDLALGSIQGDVMTVTRNLSSPGSLAFDTHVDFGAPGWVHNVTVGDFNGDGKPDLAVDGELSSFMGIWQNGSAPGAFSSASLSNRVDFSTGFNAWGLSAADLDGDGRPDVVLANIYDNTLTLYRNVTPVAGAPDHFDWNVIPSPRFTTAPFTVTIVARDATNGMVTNFNGPVLLSSTNGVLISPAASANFSQGVWTGTISVSQSVTNLVLCATDVLGATGLANPINVLVPPALQAVPVGNYLLLFWPAAPSGFTLESSSSSVAGHWNAAGGSLRQTGDQMMASVQATVASQFFRLRYTEP
jgi:hypothetical protein